MLVNLIEELSDLVRILNSILSIIILCHVLFVCLQAEEKEEEVENIISYNCLMYSLDLTHNCFIILLSKKAL